MKENFTPEFFIWFISIPFVCLTVMFIVLVFVNKNTTGEIKKILPPEILLRIFAVFLLVAVIFVLAVNNFLTESTVSALLGAIASGAIGMSLSSADRKE
ncbi:hypothetical protein [Aliarcobacter butzleri]|uniref:hypothetical protein n=1 Tax=Aliarcobacter butzleri TaxID=28197 RepID=UPI001EDF84E5|nr:hypothetical protein [Aliarcobacter butzleri]MCG3704624.1 hypothetical protein [Aliarcobacter butzleri]MDS1369782.1 hypothetical protein [Aliarcobacter butzleri]